MGQTWFELRVGSFVMPRTRAALLHSARVGAALMSGGERETMTGRALEWLTISMRALPTSLLTGTGVVNDGCTTSRSAIDLRSNAKESLMDTTEREAVGLNSRDSSRIRNSSTVNLKYKIYPGQDYYDLNVMY